VIVMKTMSTVKWVWIMCSKLKNTQQLKALMSHGVGAQYQLTDLIKAHANLQGFNSSDGIDGNMAVPYLF
jgi:hypothetical protein